MKKYLFIILWLIPFQVFAQVTNNFRKKTLSVTGDSIKIDTLSIAPSSVQLFDDKGEIIPAGQYATDPVNALIIFQDNALRGKKIKIQYRVFSFSLNKNFYNKDTSLIQPEQAQREEFWYSANDNQLRQLYDRQQLDRSGSISRGITFGNNSDMAVNSNLNLQLSGKLNDDLSIVAAITDNNIPIQPDGYSQQLQEFDKVYIKVYNQKSALTAGDFEITKPAGNYLQLYKKAQGGKYATAQPFNKNINKVFKTAIAGAVSKGKFARNSFNGTEGNQGPYRLRGNNNESYILVLAGSERVYIDGKILKRGQENDYVINYNTAELSFTPNQPITKDKRIVIEFEYAERNYTRFMIFNSNELETEKGNYWLNIYAEQDSKNQPIQQELSKSDKQTLAGIGDSLHQAIVPRIIFDTAFNVSKILYKMIDSTLSNGTSYDSVFVYSVNPDSAIYRLSFSNVGENNGNYIASRSVANGKVYRWVAPVNGIPQGNFEPIILLITPKQKQVITMGGNTLFHLNTSAAWEFGLSNNDINTFSSKDADDDLGYALKLALNQKFLVKDSSNYAHTGVQYEMIDQHFDPVERHRPVEFERDWNLQQANKATEHVLQYNLGWNSKYHTSLYNISYMNRKNSFSGLKNKVDIELERKGFEFSTHGSYLNSIDNVNSTAFFRHSGHIAQTFPFVKAGIREESEDNRWQPVQTDSLLQNSYSFNEFTVFVQNPDTFTNTYNISYTHRREHLPFNNQLALATLGDNYNFGFGLLKSEHARLKFSTNYRQLRIVDSLLSTSTPEKALISRVEYNMFLFKRAISTSTFYEIGSGLEAKKEFQYIEVAAGQGVYKWTDYNGNNIKELDEFDVARFQDQANYIRIFTPSTEYEKVYSNQFNQVVNIRPYFVWRKNKGLKKALSLFSDQLAYKIERKNIEDDFWNNVNPFTQKIDDQKIKTLNTSLKNTFSFNRTGAKFGADYIYQNNINRLLLVYGLDTRSNMKNGLRTRLRLFKFMTLKEEIDLGTKKYESSYLSGKNYEIDYLLNTFKIDFESAVRTRITAGYMYGHKKNLLPGEIAEKHEIPFELNYNALKKGVVTASASYIHLFYNAEENTAIAYEMLDGLLPGNNATWEVLFRRNLTNMLELNLNYTGRISEGHRAIHTGGVQMRANF